MPPDSPLVSLSRSALLRQQCHAFCNAFLTTNSPSSILDRFFIPDPGYGTSRNAPRPRITEYGPSVASSLPFLGTFVGRDGCLEYFSQLADTLQFCPDVDTFPGPEGFIVDPEARVEGAQGLPGAVSVTGTATFRANETGKSWREKFIYRLSGFDEKGKIGHWEIWADPLSAWMAVKDYP